MATKNRALFIDLLKGLALVVMIEVHVFNSLLIPALKSSWWWPSLNFINGLVAPTFTFTSGMVFVLSIQKSTDELRKFGKDFWKKMSRVGMVFLAGYTLHMPYFSLKKLLAHQDFQTLSSFYTVDVLQLIASGLLVLLFAKIIFKNQTHFYNFSLISAFLVLLAGPFLWKTDFSQHMPLIFAQYINRVNGSLFPIFPWWAFLFAGAYTAKLYLKARNENQEAKFAKQIVIAGLLFYLISVLLLYVIFPLSIRMLRPHPFFFLERFGVILFLLGGGWFYINRQKNYSSILLDISRESLLVYWLHLQLIYRDVLFGTSLFLLYDNKLDIWGASLVTILLVIVMMIIAKSWGIVKRQKPLWARWITIAILGVGFLFFLLRAH